jgi:hypothetical protein
MRLKGGHWIWRIRELEGQGERNLVTRVTATRIRAKGPIRWKRFAKGNQRKWLKGS